LLLSIKRLVTLSYTFLTVLYYEAPEVLITRASEGAIFPASLDGEAEFLRGN
jgi:hypothetical protein